MEQTLQSPKKEQTLEERILAQDTWGKEQPLTQTEERALQASKIARGDWGPVFVYGQMLSQQAWVALIDRIPDMQPAWFRGYERREMKCCHFAGLIRKDDESMTIGSAVFGLMPWERQLVDKIVDDGFQMIPAVIQLIDDPSEDIDATTYVWKQDKYPDAVCKDDWSQFKFNCEHELRFIGLCADLLQVHKCSLSRDDELRDKALARRREETGFEDEKGEKVDDLPEEVETEEKPADIWREIAVKQEAREAAQVGPADMTGPDEGSIFDEEPEFVINDRSGFKPKDRTKDPWGTSDNKNQQPNASGSSGKKNDPWGAETNSGIASQSPGGKSRAAPKAADPVLDSRVILSSKGNRHCSQACKQKEKSRSGVPAGKAEWQCYTCGRDLRTSSLTRI